MRPMFIALALLAAPAAAQEMDHAHMPGMAMPAPAPAKPAAPDEGAPSPAPVGTSQPAGKGPSPPIDHAADGIWGADAMAASRALLFREHGGSKFSQVMIKLAEARLQGTHPGFAWNGEGWLGGDIDRLVIKSEGEGRSGGRIEAAEIQALWSHAVDAYWNLQGGIRQDLQAGPKRTYATIGIEGIAPYFLDVEASAYLSDKGDLLGRIELTYDERITDRFILQPRIEANFAAQDIPENRIGSGLSNVDLGLRLRYEIAREFAPYVGVVYARSFGDTARFAHAAGEDSATTSFVIGIRAWF
jgi:copper resistance protein B